MRIHKMCLSPVCQYYPCQLWSLIGLHTLSSHIWGHKQFTLGFMPWKHLYNGLQYSYHIISDTLKWTKNTYTSISVDIASPESIHSQELRHVQMAVLCVIWLQCKSKVTILLWSFIIMDKNRDWPIHCIISLYYKLYRCSVQKFQFPLHLLMYY